MWQSHSIKWDSCTAELKDMCGSPHMEIGSDFHPEERKYVQRVYDICDSYKWIQVEQFHK